MQFNEQDKKLLYVVRTFEKKPCDWSLNYVLSICMDVLRYNSMNFSAIGCSNYQANSSQF
jgi:hypothetical protein